MAPKESKKRPSRKKDQNKDIIDFLMQIVRGEIFPGIEGEMVCPTISQRISASQILLRLKNGNNSADNSQIGIDIPERSQNYDDWLDKAQKMISAAVD